MDARRYDSYGPLLWFARMRARLHFAALFSFFLSLFSPGIFWRIRARTHLEWVMVWKSKRARSSVRGVQKVLLSANAVRSSARCVRERARGGALLSFFFLSFGRKQGSTHGAPVSFSFSFENTVADAPFSSFLFRTRTGHVLSHENQRYRAQICEHHLQEGGNRYG